MTKSKFFQSVVYLAILSSLTLGFWYFGWEFVGMSFFTMAAFIILILNKNGMAVIPFLLNMLFMISQTEWSLSTIPTYLFILPVVLILGFVIHMIRFKIKLLSGKLMLPLLLMFSAMLMSSGNVETIDLNYLFYCFIGLFYLSIYLFFKGSLKGDNVVFLIKTFAILGLLISTQILIFYLRVDDVIQALETKNLDLGWGISNFVATYLIIFISAMVYFIKKYKLHIFWTTLATFEIVMLLFTLSRGGILAFSMTCVFLVYYLYHGCDKKVNLSLNIVFALILTGIFIYFRSDYFIAIFQRLSIDFFHNNGRFDLWKQAFDKFINNPLFGAGLFARVNNDYFGFYHNTIFHTIATLGLLGLSSLIWQFVEITKIFLKNLNLEKSILAIGLIGANIHGLVDNVYYMPQFMIIFFIVIAAVENHNEFLMEVKVL